MTGDRRRFEVDPEAGSGARIPPGTPPRAGAAGGRAPSPGNPREKPGPSRGGRFPRGYERPGAAAPLGASDNLRGAKKAGDRRPLSRRQTKRGRDIPQPAFFAGQADFPRRFSPVSPPSAEPFQFFPAKPRQMDSGREALGSGKERGRGRMGAAEGGPGTPGEGGGYPPSRNFKPPGGPGGRPRGEGSEAASSPPPDD